jgi:type I restriction enzyme, S subunit
MVVGTPDFRNDGRIDWSRVKHRDITDVQLKPRLLRRGDILVEKSGGSDEHPAGRVVYCEKTIRGTCSNFVQLLSVNEKFHSKFVFYLLYYSYQQGLVYPFQQKTTGIINFKIHEYFKTELHLPESFTEQANIAAVLSTVDEAVEKTEKLVVKLRRIKQGLMQDLLTRGIDKQGIIRSEKTHKFKNSPLGRIPIEWEVKLLDRLAERGSGHTPDKSYPSYWNGGVKWVSLADSDKLDRIYISETSKEISTLGLRHSSAVLHPSGTVILSRDAGVGKSAILKTDMAVSQHFMAWRCGSRLNNHYLYFWLQKDKPRFEAIAFGSTIVTIGLPFFKQYSIAAPISVHEQEMIVDRLLSAEKMLEAEKTYAQKLNSLKRGLMEDLLTGKVRVKNLLAK